MPAIPPHSSSCPTRPLSWTIARRRELQAHLANCQTLLESTKHIPTDHGARMDLNLRAGALRTHLGDVFTHGPDLNDLPAQQLRDYRLLTLKLLYTGIVTGDVDWRAFAEAAVCESLARGLMERWSAPELLSDLHADGLDARAFDAAWNGCQYNFAAQLTYGSGGALIDSFPEDSRHAAAFSAWRGLHEALRTGGFTPAAAEAIAANAFATALMDALPDQDPTTDYATDTLTGHVALLSTCYKDAIGQSDDDLLRALTAVQQIAEIHVPSPPFRVPPG